MNNALKRWFVEGLRSSERWDDVVASTDLSALPEADLRRWYRKLDPGKDATAAANLALIAEIRRRGLTDVLDADVAAARGRPYTPPSAEPTPRAEPTPLSPFRKVVRAIVFVVLVIIGVFNLVLGIGSDDAARGVDATPPAASTN